VEQVRAAGVDITLIRIRFANHIYNMAVNSLGNQAGLSITQHYLVQRGLIGNER
jgi:hypothetical protein